mmetsp:Transcript_16962/g.43850  ORF Transcript_16962/g.43850 Transcript_16962/m.43850 type:complete len:299 (-) Transcript_16962:224-1120(-)
MVLQICRATPGPCTLGSAAAASAACARPPAARAGLTALAAAWNFSRILRRRSLSLVALRRLTQKACSSWSASAASASVDASSPARYAPAARSALPIASTCAPSSPICRRASSWKAFILAENWSALEYGLRWRGYSSSIASSERRSASTSACTSAAPMLRARSSASSARSCRASRAPSGVSASCTRTDSATKCSSVSASPSTVAFTADSLESTSSLKPAAPARKLPAFIALPIASTVANSRGTTGSATTASAASASARTCSRVSSARVSKLSFDAKHSSRSLMRGTCAICSATRSASES